MREIRRERKAPTYRQKRRRLGAILVPAALLSIAAGGYALLDSNEAVAAGIGCFETAELDGNVTVLETSGEDPVVVCKEQWEMGNLGAQGPVPEMTACLNGSGAVYVLPSDEQGLCTRLGLQDLPDDYVAEAQRFAEMRDDVTRSLEREIDRADGCIEADKAVEVAETALARHHFSDWGVELLSGDGYEGRQCANYLGFDDKEKKVQVIPSPPRA